nr:premnaspirodiene oxygenase-like isoform X1 [Coffea arabica]
MDLSSNSIPLSLFLAFVLALLMQWKRPNAAAQKQKLPPSPWKLPFIGNLHHLVGSLPHHALRKLAQKHGPLMHLQLGELSAIVVSSPRMAEEVMKTHDLAFADRAVSQATRIVVYGASDIAFAPYGDYWRQMHKICTQELLSARTVQSFSPIRQAEASRLVSSIQALAGGKEPINIAEKLYMYSSSMIRRSAFGKVSRDDQNAFVLIIKDGVAAKGMEIADLFPSYKFLHFFSVVKIKLEKWMQKQDKVLSNILRQHIRDFATKKSSTGGEFGQEDLIDVLLRVRESGGLQCQMTDDNIKAVIVTVADLGGPADQVKFGLML